MRLVSPLHPLAREIRSAFFEYSIEDEEKNREKRGERRAHVASRKKVENKKSISQREKKKAVRKDGKGTE